MPWTFSALFQPSDATAVLQGLESITRGAEHKISQCPVLLDRLLIKDNVFTCDINSVYILPCEQLLDVHFSPVDLTMFHTLRKWIFGTLKAQFIFPFYSSIILGCVCVCLHIDARGWMSSH